MNPETSAPWAQTEAREAKDALVDLARLESDCTFDQRHRRRLAFKRAFRFIEQARPHGVGPCSESWPRTPEPDAHYPDARVDIEVRAGKAFVR